MLWKIILGGFGPNIRHMSGVENIVSDTLSRLCYTKYNINETSTIMELSFANTLLATRCRKLLNMVYP